MNLHDIATEADGREVVSFRLLRGRVMWMVAGYLCRGGRDVVRVERYDDSDGTLLIRGAIYTPDTLVDQSSVEYARE